MVRWHSRQGRLNTTSPTSGSRTRTERRAGGAAAQHDDGKDRALWQATIGNGDHPRKKLAKSGHRRPPEIKTSSRHEFGSLLDVLESSKLSEHPCEVKELILHLIAAHHGR